MGQVTAIIPARLESTRFPSKVLHLIDGKPLVYHVWRGARRARLIDRLFVATDSMDIARAVIGFGGAVIMTSHKPRNGSERVAEAATHLRTELVINIQGDNMGITGGTLDRVIGALLDDKRIAYATLARKIRGRDWQEKLYNPDVVKVVGDSSGNALWFSRYPIPFVKNDGKGQPIDRYPFMEHLGIYFFRKKALMEYAGWPRGMAEKAESLEQLRILEHGRRIKLFLTRSNIISVDRKEPLYTRKG